MRRPYATDDITIPVVIVPHCTSALLHAAANGGNGVLSLCYDSTSTAPAMVAATKHSISVRRVTSRTQSSSSGTCAKLPVPSNTSSTTASAAEQMVVSPEIVSGGTISSTWQQNRTQMTPRQVVQASEDRTCNHARVSIVSPPADEASSQLQLQAVLAEFGSDPDSLPEWLLSTGSRRLAGVEAVLAEPMLADAPLINAASVVGKLVVIQRGKVLLPMLFYVRAVANLAGRTFRIMQVPFVSKARCAVAAGASGIIFLNTTNDDFAPVRF